MAAGFGDSLTNPGNPVGVTKVLTANGISNEPSPHPIQGFSVIKAADMEDALN